MKTNSRILPKLTLDQVNADLGDMIHDFADSLRTAPAVDVDDRSTPSQAYGETADNGGPEFAYWPEIKTICASPDAPAGQCEYSMRDNFTRCIYCGMPDQ